MSQRPQVQNRSRQLVAFQRNLPQLTAVPELHCIQKLAPPLGTLPQFSGFAPS